MPIPLRKVESKPHTGMPNVPHPERKPPELDKVSGTQTGEIGKLADRVVETLGKNHGTIAPKATDIDWVGARRAALAVDFKDPKDWEAAQEGLESLFKGEKGIRYGLDLFFHAPAALFQLSEPHGRVKPGERIRAHLVAYTKKGEAFISRVVALARQ